MNSAYIVDHSNMVYRFRNVYHFAKVNINGATVDYSTLYGYVKAIKANFYNDILICLDGVPHRSHELLPGYKGQRLYDPSEDLRVTELEVVKFLSAIGPKLGKKVTVLAAPGQEADQAISSIVHIIADQAPKNHSFFTKAFYNMDVSLDSDRRLKKLEEGCVVTIPEFEFDSSIIASTDSDMFQLLKFPNVHMDASTAGRRLLDRTYTPKAVKGLKPSCIAAYKMIVGDVSDNVPRAPVGIEDRILIKTIEMYLDSDDKTDKFLDQIKNYPFTKELSESKLLSSLQRKIIKTKTLNQILINKEVTKLVYLSTPFELNYPEYDIKETIDRYKLII